MKSRIYLVTIHNESATESAVRLVRAPSASQAVKFIACPMILATIPTQEQLVDLGADGVKIEEAN